MSDFLTGLKEANNLTFTENGALTHRSTTSDLLDLFALGGAYRNRTDMDIIQLVNKAFCEDEVYTLKCLFYLRDIREGQGERRFFKTAIKFLATDHTDAIRRNLKMIPVFGRWDDLYALVDTPLEDEMFKFMYEQLCLDFESKTPSLLGKWLKSENASSKETKLLAYKTRMAFNFTSKQYRKILTYLRTKINVLETLMSENRWDEIEFDKIPSVAGLKYRNAFARRDIIKEKYRKFAMDENSTVNAKVLYPYQCIHEVMKHIEGWWGLAELGDVDRAIINKYWDNLADYINNAEFNGIAVVDTSGSMDQRCTDTLTAAEIACVFGGMLRKSHPNTDVVAVATTAEKVALTSQMNVMEMAKRIEMTDVGYATMFGSLMKYYDNHNFVLLITDGEQADNLELKWKESQKPDNAKIIIWQLVPNRTKISRDPSIIHLCGYSDRILSLIKKVMEGKLCQVDEIEKISL